VSQRMNQFAAAGIKTRIERAREPTWHAEPVDRIYLTLGTGPRGLVS
jgi:hypothetical protein